MKASDLFVKCLETEGVEYIFGVPGEENLDFLESLRTSKIKLVVNRHEQCSAFMAATYGRLTGKPGVCLSTLGPGATNLITGIAHAQLGGMPLIAITGQKAVRESVQANFQVLDVVGMMRPITKRAVQIVGPRQIPKEIRQAFKTATTERQGACHIELPEDIAHEGVEDIFQPHVPGYTRRPSADIKSIREVVRMIRSAKMPIIIVSSRGQRKLVSDEIKKFCDQTNIYVIHTQLGKGILGDDHKNSLFAFGIHKKDYVHCAIERSDLIITIGYSTVEHPPSVWNKELNKKIVHMDYQGADTDIYYNPICEVVGDINSSLRAIATELGSQDDGEYRHEGLYEARLRVELQEKLFSAGSEDSSFPMRPRRIVSDIRKALGKEDFLCLDNGIYKLWFSRHYPTYHYGTYLLDNTLATMGAGLPSAMATKLVHPDRKVIAVCGDGGFMMNSQELETAVRLKLNIVIIILNDNAYGFIKWKQQAYKFPSFALDYTNPDFVKYAEAYGAHGFRVSSAFELLPAIEKAFGLQGPVLIECPIDYSENKLVWNDELDSIVCPR